MKNRLIYLLFAILFSVPAEAFSLSFIQVSFPQPLSIGVSLPLNQITTQKLKYAKSVGINSLQISVGEWLDEKGDIKVDENQMKKEVEVAKRAIEKTGLVVAAIHMPYGRYIDLSLINDSLREKVVAIHKKILLFCSALQPRVILFHPSWFLTLNQRDGHIDQLVKSVNELRGPVSNLGALMVIENMTGPELYVEYKGAKYERPLGRSIAEMKDILNRLPNDVYAAVDLNHILHPEKMILALGGRVKFIHVSDGDGAHEFHYYPCSGKGMNDWVSIIDALYSTGYTGPFMFECHYKDLEDLPPCYNFLYNKFILEKYIRSKYP